MGAESPNEPPAGLQYEHECSNSTDDAANATQNCTDVLWESTGGLRIATWLLCVQPTTHALQ
jgi:hypothetical protein